ncbi:hypothetical protein OIU85_019767 [Salix viminalis]|uniref:Uncharacterized protein n=1 Tax=Salix viminalis TaxID=40686 RepID=A0A9Q0ZKF9_SALVM|nr:hypothetical protein OIU85_019767 [Salix viminalis]
MINSEETRNRIFKDKEEIKKVGEERVSVAWNPSFLPEDFLEEDGRDSTPAAAAAGGPSKRKGRREKGGGRRRHWLGSEAFFVEGGMASSATPPPPLPLLLLHAEKLLQRKLARTTRISNPGQHFHVRC